MSHGFKTGNSQADSATIRKPTEGEFKAWLPTVGLPFPFKEAAAQTYDLAVADGISISVAEVIGLIQEHELSIQDGANLSVSDQVSLTQEIALNISDAVVINAAPEINLEQEHVLAVADLSSVSVTETIALTQIGTDLLTVDDAVNIQAAETVALEQEHVLASSDAYSAAIGDGADLEQEHVLLIGDTAVVSTADSVGLGVIGDQILAVDDSAVVAVSDVVALEIIAAPVVVKKGGRRRPAYFFPQPEPKEKKPVVNRLRVQDGVVETTADTVEIYAVTSLSIINGGAKVANSGPVNIQYFRCKRRIQEDEILLMAA